MPINSYFFHMLKYLDLINMPVYPLKILSLHPTSKGKMCQLYQIKTLQYLSGFHGSDMIKQSTLCFVLTAKRAANERAARMKNTFAVKVSVISTDSLKKHNV